MSTRLARHRFLVAPLALSVMLASRAGAEQTPTPRASEVELQPEPASGTPTEAAASARELGNRGLVAYSAGDFGSALEHFGRAEELAHSPVFQLYIARSLVALGRIEEGRAVYRSILDRVPDGSAEVPSSSDPAAGTGRPPPDPWLRARGDAERELAVLPPAEKTRIPEATSPPAEAPKDKPKDEPKPQTSDSLSRPDAPSEGLGAQRWAAVSAFTVGGVGLVTAAVTGSVALSLAAEVRDNCVDSVCPAEDQPKADRATALGNVATASVVVAAVGTLTGVTLLALAPPRRKQPTLALEARGPALVLHGRF